MRARICTRLYRRACLGSGFAEGEVYEDAGISGAKRRDKRRAFDRLLKDATRRKFDMVAA